MLGSAVANAQPLVVSGMELVIAEPCAKACLTEKLAQAGVKKLSVEQAEGLQKTLQAPFTSIPQHKKRIEYAASKIMGENHVATIPSSHRSIKQAVYNLCTQPKLADTCGGVEAVVNRLCDYEKVLCNVPGFITQCQPKSESLVQRIISAQHERNVRGALYEAAVAAELEKAGEVVEMIGLKVKGFGNRGTKDFDVVTTKLAIECKDWDWSIAGRFEQVRTDIGKAKVIAEESLRKRYCLYSKNLIPEHIKNWLNNNDIFYVEFDLI